MKHLLNINDFITEKKSPENIQKYISNVDYTELSPDASNDDIIKICEKAKEYKTATVCVLPKAVKTASEELKGSSVGVCTVVSFPGGTNSLKSKISECNKVLSDGADEVDMVLDYKKLKKYMKDTDKKELREELVEEVKELKILCKAKGKILKVIVESGLLTDDETKESTLICKEAGADYIKTSTGKVKVGAELSKVKIMKANKGSMKIKASGAIRTLEDIKSFAPFVDRFGVGFGSIDSIMTGIKSDSKY